MAEEEIHTPAEAGGGALEEGMFYERVFGPTSVEVKSRPLVRNLENMAGEVPNSSP